jgi:hypothetical protein
MKVFRQNSRPDPNWVELGDLWIDPDRDPLNAVFMCVDVLTNPDTGERKQTYRKLVPQMDTVPPSDITGLSLVFSGVSPERSISLVATDEDGSQHTVAEIMY